MSPKAKKPTNPSKSRPTLPGGGIQAGEAILRIMLDYGITDIFASPGSDWPAVWEALAKRRHDDEELPRYYNCRDEVQTVSMAAGYYRATGRLPGVLLHTGVGVLHGAMALRSAMRGFTPMLVLAGDSDCFGEDPLVDPGFQWLDQLADVGGAHMMAEPYVKWATKVPSPHALPMMVAHACRLALAPPMGPVVLSMSMEVTFEDVPAKLMPKVGVEVTATRPDAAAIAEVADLLRKSRNPIIVTQNAGVDPNNVEKLVALAEEMSIPVVESGRSAMNMPSDHPLHVGYNVHSVCKNADLLLLIGARTPWHPASNEPAPGAKVVVLDDEARAQMPMWNYRNDLFVHGSIGALLDDLLAELQATGAAKKARGLKKRYTDAKAVHNAMRKGTLEVAHAAGDLPTMQDRWVSHVLGEMLPADAIIVEETITSTPSISQHIPRTQPGTFIRKFGGGLGIGFGTALGVKVACPDRIVVSLAGDGTFFYSPALACLGYMQEYHAPILVVVYDNQAYAAMRGSLLKYYPTGYAAKTGVHYGSDIKPQTDYAGLAPLFGGYGELVKEPAQMRPALERGLKALESGKFVILQACIDEPRH